MQGPGGSKPAPGSSYPTQFLAYGHTQITDAGYPNWTSYTKTETPPFQDTLYGDCNCTDYAQPDATDRRQGSKPCCASFSGAPCPGDYFTLQNNKGEGQTGKLLKTQWTASGNPMGSYGAEYGSGLVQGIKAGDTKGRMCCGNVNNNLWNTSGSRKIQPTGIGIDGRISCCFNSTTTGYNPANAGPNWFNGKNRYFGLCEDGTTWCDPAENESKTAKNPSCLNEYNLHTYLFRRRNR